jgi:hypothetical protein
MRKTFLFFRYEVADESAFERLAAVIGIALFFSLLTVVMAFT